MQNECRCGQRPGHRDQVSATHDERRRGQPPGATIKYLRCTTSGSAGDGLGTTIKYLRAAAGIGLGVTIKYLRRSTSGAAGNGLRTTMNYLRGAAGISLSTSTKYLRRATSAAANNGPGIKIKYLVIQNAGASNNSAKTHIHRSWARIQTNPPCSVAAFVLNSEPHTGARPSVRLCVGPEVVRTRIRANTNPNDTEAKPELARCVR
jgi:hypothetical protein